MSGTRAQAALEYLVTYGWGFIAILVVVGALAYFGFLSPTRYLPARCDFGSQLDCIDYRLEDNTAKGHSGCVLLRVRNDFGDAIRIYGVKTIGGTGDTYAGGVDCDPAIAQTMPSNGRYAVIPKGEASANLSVIIAPTDKQFLLTRGDRTDVQLLVEFSRDLNGSPRHNLTGEIFATVAAPGS